MSQLVTPSTNSGLTRRIIPCLDVTAGRVVKGVNFVDLIATPLKLRSATTSKVQTNSPF